tara:strand:+ start:2639 stop:2812 length:174 start_codon:yes stop_codon:yes gene_type:complete
MKESNELNNEMKELLKNINICCIKISEKKNFNCEFKKLDFLKNTNFYNNYPNTKFIE